MAPMIELVVALVLPLVLFTIFRINAAMVFLSLCLGYVLVEFVAPEAYTILAGITPKANEWSATTIQLSVLFLPVVLTSLIMLFSLHGKMRLIFNLLPAAGVGLLGVLMAVPMLTPGVRGAFESLPLWIQLSKAQVLVVGVGAIISLFFLWTQRRKALKEQHAGKHHR